MVVADVGRRRQREIDRTVFERKRSRVRLMDDRWSRRQGRVARGMVEPRPVLRTGIGVQALAVKVARRHQRRGQIPRDAERGAAPDPDESDFEPGAVREFSERRSGGLAGDLQKVGAETVERRIAGGFVRHPIHSCEDHGGGVQFAAAARPRRLHKRRHGAGKGIRNDGAARRVGGQQLLDELRRKLTGPRKGVRPHFPIDIQAGLRQRLPVECEHGQGFLRRRRTCLHEMTLTRVHRNCPTVPDRFAWRLSRLAARTRPLADLDPLPGQRVGARPVEARVTVSGTVGRQARPAVVRRAGNRRNAAAGTGRGRADDPVIAGKAKNPGFRSGESLPRYFPCRCKIFRAAASRGGERPRQAPRPFWPAAARPARKTARRYSKKANKGPAITAWARSASWIPTRWSTIACSPAGGMLSPTISRIVLSLKRLSSARAHR